jgi:hypothetical protein
MKTTELKALIREEVKKALTENTDLEFYYKGYSREVKNAAKAIKDIISNMSMRVSRDNELYDAIIELVDAVKSDQDAEI